MKSKVDIANGALVLVGAQRIAAFDEENDRARTISTLYDSVKNSVLRSHPWNCCIKRIALSPLTDAPAFDFAYQFTMPSDCVKILQVGEYMQEINYRIEAGKILSDEPALFLRYVSNEFDESTFDDLLFEALTIALAAQIAYPITQSDSRQQTMEQKLAMVMREARAADGQDDPPETLGDTPLVNSRFAGTRW